MGYVVSARFQVNVSYVALRFFGPGRRIFTRQAGTLGNSIWGESGLPDAAAGDLSTQRRPRTSHRENRLT